MPQPLPSVRLSSSAQADLLLASERSLRLISKYASLRLASGPVPQPACWRVLRVCDWPQAQPSQQLATQPQAQVCMKRASQQPAQAQRPGRPATRPAPAPSPPAGPAQRAKVRPQANTCETDLKLCQLLSLSDVPQSGCPSSSAQAGQALTSWSRLAPSHPAAPAPSAQSQHASLRLS